MTGRYIRYAGIFKFDIKFQSSPGLVTGRYCCMSNTSYGKEGFNPRPVW